MNESKNTEDKTQDQDDSTDEEKDQNQSAEDNQDTASQTADSEEQDSSDDGDEDVTITKKELETLKKKSENFENMIKEERLAKLSKKNKLNSTEDGDSSDDTASGDVDENAILAKAKEVAKETASQILMANNKGEFDKNLKEVYGGWVGNNPWADNDEITDELASHFTPTNSNNKEDIVAALDRAALEAYPKSFMEAVKAKAKREVLAEDNNIDVGDAGSSTSESKTKTTKQISKADKDIADRFFKGDVDRYMKYKN